MERETHSGYHRLNRLPVQSEPVHLGNLDLEVIGMATKVGSPAVKFELPDAGGVTHGLSEYAGSWLLLVFHRHLG